jgi:hypothetical protein
MVSMLPDEVAGVVSEPTGSDRVPMTFVGAELTDEFRDPAPPRYFLGEVSRVDFKLNNDLVPRCGGSGDRMEASSFGFDHGAFHIWRRPSCVTLEPPNNELDCW